MSVVSGAIAFDISCLGVGSVGSKYQFVALVSIDGSLALDVACI